VRGTFGHASRLQAVVMNFYDVALAVIDWRSNMYIMHRCIK